MPPKQTGGLDRTPSGRDKKKAAATRKSLGASPPAIRSPPLQMSSDTSKTYTLVVCGATDPNHSFIWADWMAFCKFFSMKGVGGDFLSCFPLDKAFGLLSNRNIDTIKFGYVDPAKSTEKNAKAILSYSRFQLVQRDQWWEDVKPELLKTAVVQWIRDTAAKAKPGDVVNIVFESHGNEYGAVKLGCVVTHKEEVNIYMGAYEFAKEIEAFQLGVHVNAISGACYSGLFREVIESRNQLNRYVSTACGSEEKAKGLPRSVSGQTRGSRYEYAFVRSLAQLETFGGPSRGPNHITRTVAEHEQFILQHIQVNLGLATDTSQKPQNPEFYTDNPEALATAIENMLFRDKVDVLCDPELTSRRRRIEWPCYDIPLAATVDQTAAAPDPSLVAKAAALQLIDSEATKCVRGSGDVVDMSIFNIYNPPRWVPHDPVKIGEVLTALYWRGRVQSTVLDVFSMLVQRDFVTIESLRSPMSPTVGESTWTVSVLLGTFEYVTKEEITRGYELHESYSTNTAMDWLAMMIVRGFADLPRLFETIEASGFLGRINEDRLAEYKSVVKHRSIDKKIVYCNPNEGVYPTPDYHPYFGFFLPHGVGNNASIEDLSKSVAKAYNFFDQIERVYKAYFKVSDDVILTADRQAEYLEMNPGKVASRTLSMHLLREAAYRRASSTETSGFQSMSPN